MKRLAGAGERMPRFFTELRRRRVFRVGAANALVGWFLIQAADVIVEPLRLPEWIQPLLIMTVFLGFPVAILLAWAFDLTPGGVERTPLLRSDETLPESTAITAGPRMDRREPRVRSPAVGRAIPGDQPASTGPLRGDHVGSVGEVVLTTATVIE
jgi:hypothetical protein